jgi:hypothetical protein
MDSSLVDGLSLHLSPADKKLLWLVIAFLSPEPSEPNHWLQSRFIGVIPESP